MIDLVVYSVLPTAMSLLPPGMDSPQARAMLVAIGLQESKFLARRQDLDGPARGFWQFEKNGGCRAVLEDHRTQRYAIATLRRLRYPVDVVASSAVHPKLEDNDILACVFARLLLFQVPRPLPVRHEVNEAWRQYLDGWHPGKPRPGTWAGYYAEAWERVQLHRDTLSAGETT